jgi:hypothetical protein
MCILKFQIDDFSENIDGSLYNKHEGIDLKIVTEDTIPTG